MTGVPAPDLAAIQLEVERLRAEADRADDQLYEQRRRAEIAEAEVERLRNALESIRKLPSRSDLLLNPIAKAAYTYADNALENK